MAIIKSYTDLEQSKKLAEFLPLESADMKEEWRDIEGYHQAEKDLELTWEDMRELYIIFTEVDTEIELCKTDITAETLGYYQEVLNRFKEKKK